MWIALSHLGTCICHSELRLDLGFSQALADALLQRKTSVRDTTADSDLDDGAKAWGSEWLHASCITMRRGLSFSVAAALISKYFTYLDLVQLFEKLAKFTSVSCGMLNRRVLIKSPADALLKHRFVFRQVSCVAAQGDNVLLSGRELVGLCTTFQFSFPQGLLLIFGQPPGAVLQRFFFCVNRIDISWFTVPTQRFSQCDIC